MEFAYASRVSVPQPRQASATPCLEEWRETVRAELRKEMKDQLNVLKDALTETVTDEIKCQLSPQTNPVVHRDVTPPREGESRGAAIHPHLDNLKHLNGINGANLSVEAVVRLVISRGVAQRGGS